MRGPTRRISFYLKPEVVRSEKEACDFLDNLPASERSRAQRAAFLAGLALIMRNPALAYWLAEWPEDDVINPPPQDLSRQHLADPIPKESTNINLTKKNIALFFPE